MKLDRLTSLGANGMGETAMSPLRQSCWASLSEGCMFHCCWPTSGWVWRRWRRQPVVRAHSSNKIVIAFSFDWIMLSYNSIIDRITMTFCTFNDFYAVLTWANYRCSPINTPHTREMTGFFYRIWSIYDRIIVNGTSTWCITTLISLSFDVCQARTQTYGIFIACI